MRNFVIRIIINAIAIVIAAALIPGISVTNALGPVLIVGLAITVVNALVRPILTLLTCPAVILTLGLFILVINGVLLQIAAYFTGSNFDIDGFGAAFLGGIVMALVNMALEGFFQLDERPEYPEKRDV